MPIKQALPIHDITRETVLIYGDPGVGKSTFAAQFPDAVFLATEPGLDKLNCARWEYDDGQYVLKNWEDLRNATADAIEAGAKVIVLDTVEYAYLLCEQYVCTKYGVEYKTDGVLAYGKGSSMITSEFRRYVLKLTSSGIGVVMISHTLREEIESRTGKYTKTVPSIPERVRPDILGMVNMVLFCDVDAKNDPQGKLIEKHVIRTKPSRFYESKDRGAILPESLPLDFAEFMKAYSVAPQAE